MTWLNVHDIKKPEKPIKKECLECKKVVVKKRDAFNFDGMPRENCYCRDCYFKKLE